MSVSSGVQLSGRHLIAEAVANVPRLIVSDVTATCTATAVGARWGACDVAGTVSGLTGQRASQGVGIVAIRLGRLGRQSAVAQNSTQVSIYSHRTSRWPSNTISFRKASEQTRCARRTWPSRCNWNDSPRRFDKPSERLDRSEDDPSTGSSKRRGS